MPEENVDSNEAQRLQRDGNSLEQPGAPQALIQQEALRNQADTDERSSNAYLEDFDTVPMTPARSLGSVSMSEVPLREDLWSIQDSDGDGLTNGEEVILGTDLSSADTDRDGVSDYQEVVSGTNPVHPDAGIEPSVPEVDVGSPELEPQPPPERTQLLQSFTQDPAIASLDAELAKDSPSPAQPLDSPSDLASEVIHQQLSDPQVVEDKWTPQTAPATASQTEQPSFFDTLYRRLQEHSDLDVNQVALSVYQGSDLLYRGSPQAEWEKGLPPELHQLLQNTLDAPSGLEGELFITANSQVIFHVVDGELKFDQYGLAGQRREVQEQIQPQSDLFDQSAFDASATHHRYREALSKETQSFAPQAPMNVFEQVAEKTLGDGISHEQAKQVLQQDPFYQTLALGVGRPEAERYTQNLLTALAPQASAEGRVGALESRVQNLESLNRQLSSELKTLNQTLERLSHSKAFESKSPHLNQFLGGVRESTQQAGKTLSDHVEQLSTQVTQQLHQMRESLSNTWQAAKTSLQQKAGEISLSAINASATAATQWFGQESKEGLRVIDATSGQRLELNQQGEIQIARKPEINAAWQYQRLSQRVDVNLPPSAQVKRIAQAALKEQFTTSQVQSILSETPKFKEISSVQGIDKANQFAGVAITAAQRQNAVNAEAQPSKQQETQSQKQFQA